MKIRILFLFVFSLALCSCSSGTDKPLNTSEVKDSMPAKESFPTGKVIEKITVLNDASQSYALYLPSGYTAERSWPVMYAFDAQGSGKLPVTMYKNLAEKYGYILIGSNNSRNGVPWKETEAIANKLFADSQERLSIKAGSIYLMGFSGGARVANALCITNGAVAGAISCGAAAPAANSKDPRNNYTFLGICGNKDFNYIEMRKYDMIELAGKGVKHAFIEFDGKHEWPPEEIMKEAFLWSELGAMRKDPALKNDAFIKNELAIYDEKIKDARQNKKTFETYNLVRRTINFFDGLTDLTAYHAIYKPLKANAEVDAKLKKEEATWKKEEELKAFYQEAIQTKNTDWWKQDIAALNKKIKTAKDPDEVLMYYRVLDYLSIVAYMQTINAMKQNSLPAAKMLSAIYVLVDPYNSETHYLSAGVHAMEGNDKEAINSLNEALKNGFADFTRLENDPVFLKLSASEEFKAILQKMKDAGMTSASKQ